MSTMLSYIFNSLANADADLRKINKALRTQSALNGIFAGVIYFAVNQLKQQQEEIKKLTEEVEELKKEKGE